MLFWSSSSVAKDMVVACARVSKQLSLILKKVRVKGMVTPVSQPPPNANAPPTFRYRAQGELRPQPCLRNTNTLLLQHMCRYRTSKTTILHQAERNSTRPRPVGRWERAGGRSFRGSGEPDEPLTVLAANDCRNKF